MEGSGDNIGGSLSGPHTYAGKHTAKVEHIKLYGVFKGKSALQMFDRHANLKYKYGNRD